MTVSSGWNSREVSLNGRLIGVTVSTPGSAGEAARSGPASARPDLADDGDDDVRSGADVVERRHPLGQDLALHAEDLGLGGGRWPSRRTSAASPSSVASGQTKKQRSRLCFLPARPVPPGLATGNDHAGHRK